MSETPSELLVTHDGAVQTITLNRPSVLNALDLAMHKRLADAGNTVLVIEHNLDVIKQADWVLDLGPEGGDKGGEILAQGTPEEVAETPGSATGKYMRRVLPVYAAERALA